MESVLQSNCIHKWLHLMEGIFTSNIDACPYYYPYDEFEGDYSFEFWIILHEEEGKGGEYVK